MEIICAFLFPFYKEKNKEDKEVLNWNVFRNIIMDLGKFQEKQKKEIRTKWSEERKERKIKKKYWKEKITIKKLTINVNRGPKLTETNKKYIIINNQNFVLNIIR